MDKQDDVQSISTLHCILYVSSETRAASNDDLEHLLASARERNKAAGITGVLLYRDQCFMQYIEGPSQEVVRIYGIIKNHPLHSGIVEIIDEPVIARLFPEWPMAFKTKYLHAPTYIDQYASLLHPESKEYGTEGAGAFRVLYDFWNNA